MESPEAYESGLGKKKGETIVQLSAGRTGIVIRVEKDVNDKNVDTLWCQPNGIPPDYHNLAKLAFSKCSLGTPNIFLLQTSTTLDNNIDDNIEFVHY